MMQGFYGQNLRFVKFFIFYDFDLRRTKIVEFAFLSSGEGQTGSKEDTICGRKKIAQTIFLKQILDNPDYLAYN